MEIFGKICFAVLSIIIATLLRGFVLMKVWGWFVVTVFDLPSITTFQAIGLSFVIASIKGYSEDKDEKKKDESTWDKFVKTTVTILIYYGVTLFFGWILHLIIR